MNVPNIKFFRNLSSKSPISTCAQMDVNIRQTGDHDEANWMFHDNANVPKTITYLSMPLQVYKKLYVNETH